MDLSRRMALLLPVALVACTGDNEAVRQDFPALHYDYLTPLRLNVGAVDVGEAPPPGPLDTQNPASPGAALRQMALDRIGAGGTAGRAVFHIDAAQILEGGGGLQGILAVRLDILDPGGGRVAFAEARVSRQSAGSRGGLRAALYDMTRSMMDDMNIEFEFQVRRSLKAWLQDATTAPAPAPVEQQDLGTPGAT